MSLRAYAPHYLFSPALEPGDAVLEHAGMHARALSSLSNATVLSTATEVVNYTTWTENELDAFVSLIDD